MFDTKTLTNLHDVYTAQNSYAEAILDPVKYDNLKREAAQKAKNTDENKANYLEKLTDDGKPFTSLNDIMSAITNLNNKIVKK